MNLLHRMFSRVDGTFDEVEHPNTGLTLESGQVENVLSFFFMVAGIIAVMMIILGGFWYVTSGGEPQKTKKAKDTILYAVGGLVISISAWVIVGFVMGRA